jgi:hypothetical protein
VKNAEIVKALPNLKSLQYEHEALKRQIQNLTKQEQQLQREIGVLGRVTEIFEGVALTVNEKAYANGPALDVHAADFSLARWADVYPNAHNGGKDWGLNMRDTSGAGPARREKWGGTGWPFAEACAAARAYVAHGTEPTEAYIEMIKLRHALDPERKAPKRRRDAFEAAYTAGHVELAKELLVGRAKLSAFKKTEREDASDGQLQDQ